MAKDNSVDDALSGLLESTASSARNRISQSNATTPDPTTRMLSIFEEAFPDQTFTKTERGIVGTQKIVAPGPAVPTGYAPDKAMTGIEEMRVALESKDLTDEERFSMATRLSTMVQVQKMYKFEQYRTQAEAMYGVPDLLQTIESLKRAEAASPYNPGNGAMSQQRFEVLQTLATARNASAARVKELMVTDPTYAAAEALAGGTIAEIEGRLKIGERSDRVDLKRAAQQAREDQIASIEPMVIASIGIMRNGKAPETPEERRAIAERLIDNKLKLTKTETALASASDEAVKGLYTAYKDPNDKKVALQVLEGREVLAVNDAKQAKLNVKFFEQVMKIDPSSKDDPRVTPDIRRQWAAIQNDARMAKVAGSDKSDAELVAERKVKLHDKILESEVNKYVYSNVQTWKGVIASDQVAQSVMKKIQIEHGNKPVDINRFMDEYLEYNDGRKPIDKTSSLEAIITSAVGSLPRSVVLPPPSEQSAQLQAKKLILARSIGNKFHSTGIIGLDYVRSYLPGGNNR